MARPPLPADQRRTEYVALRLTKAEEATVRTVASAEHGGDRSAAIRALLAEVLVTREALMRVRALCEDLQSESVVAGEMADIDTLWPSDVLDAIAGRGPRWEDEPG